MPSLEDTCSNMMNKLWEMRQNNVICDTVIPCKNKESLYCHSAVLAASSEKLCQLLVFQHTEHNFRDDMNCRYWVDLSSHDPDVVEIVLQYMYTRDVSLFSSAIAKGRLMSIFVLCKELGINVEVEELPVSAWNLLQSNENLLQEFDKPLNKESYRKSSSSLEFLHCNDSMVINKDPLLWNDCSDISAAHPSKCKKIKSDNLNSVDMEVKLEHCFTNLASEDEMSVVAIDFFSNQPVKSTEIMSGDTTNHTNNTCINNNLSDRKTKPMMTLSDSMHVKRKKIADRKSSSSKLKKERRKPLTYECTQCDEMFPNRPLYEKHKAKHRSIMGPILCNVCGKSFKYSSNLQQHVVIHTRPIRNYTCLLCKKNFLKKNLLLEHKRIHRSERDYICETCGKQFKTNGQLNSHTKIHVGVKNFMCQTCHKSFLFRGELARHQRVHADVFPFVCETCGKGFKFSSNLHAHVRSHQGRKAYTCDVCSRSYVHKSHLIRHQKLHEAEANKTNTDSNLDIDTSNNNQESAVLFFSASVS